MGNVEVGTRLPGWRVDPVEVWPMKVMALLLDDPNRIHWDPDNVAALGLGSRPINQGPNNVGYIVNMLLAWAGDPEAVRRVSVRFHGNVFAGDVVEAGGEVLALDPETHADSDGEAADGGRLATCAVWLDRGDDRVVSGTADVFLAG